MISFIHKNLGILAVTLSLLTFTQAAYHMTIRSRPSMSLMYPRMSRPSPFSRDMAQVMNNFDRMFDSMSTMSHLENMFYEPFAMQQRLMSKPSYFLSTPNERPLASMIPKQTYEIVQDEKQMQIRINLPEIEPKDINLQVDEDNRLVKISGETNRDEDGMSMRSSFERSFSLTPDIDVSNVSAQFDNGVLSITAPKKHDSPKEEKVRRIDIVDTTEKEAIRDAAAPVANEDVKTNEANGVIDLDVE